jgi:hypothetical protein
MQCIFLDVSKLCTAELPQFAHKELEMDSETITKYCKTETFNGCPRYRAYMEYSEKTKK